MLQVLGPTDDVAERAKAAVADKAAGQVHVSDLADVLAIACFQHMTVADFLVAMRRLVHWSTVTRMLSAEWWVGAEWVGALRKYSHFTPQCHLICLRLIRLGRCAPCPPSYAWCPRMHGGALVCMLVGVSHREWPVVHPRAG